MEALETEPSPHRRLLNALYLKSKDRDLNIAPADTTKLTRFAIAAPRSLPAIGVDLERRARRFLSSSRFGFLLITLQALNALVASCSSSTDASTLALFDEHVVIVIELCILHTQLRVRAAALRLCAQFIEGQDFMVSQARLEFFLSPILQGCRVEAASASQARRAIASPLSVSILEADTDAVRAASFGALRQLLVKADVQGLEAFVPTVVPALLDLMLAEHVSGGSGVMELCEHSISAIVDALNAATASFIYAPVLRYLDARAWQPLGFAVRVLGLFDPASREATAPEGGEVHVVSSDTAMNASAAARKQVPGGTFGISTGTYGARRPAFTVPIVVTVLRHLARVQRTFDAAAARDVPARGHALSMSYMDEPSDLSTAAPLSKPGGEGLALLWLYATDAAVGESAPSTHVPTRLPAPPAFVRTVDSAVRTEEFEHLRSGLLRAVLSALGPGPCPGGRRLTQDLGSWAQQCLELLAPTVFESTEIDLPNADATSSTTVAASSPELAACLLARLARSLNSLPHLMHFFSDVLDCYEEHAIVRALNGGASPPTRVSIPSLRVDATVTGLGLAPGGASPSNIHRKSSRGFGSAAAFPARLIASNNDADVAGAAAVIASAVPIGPSTLFLSVAVIAVARIRELSCGSSSEEPSTPESRTMRSPRDAYGLRETGTASQPSLAISVPREVTLALELALCDARPSLRALGLCAWHHLLCAGTDAACPAADADGSLEWRQWTRLRLHPALRDFDAESLALNPDRVRSAPSVGFGGGHGGVHFPVDALPRLISALVSLVLSACKQTSNPPSVVNPLRRQVPQSSSVLKDQQHQYGAEPDLRLIACALRTVRGVLRAAPVEVIWRLLPAAFTLFQPNGMALSDADTWQPPSSRETAHVTSPVKATAPSPVSAVIPSLYSSRVDSYHIRRLAAAGWLAGIATAIGSEPLRVIASEVLGGPIATSPPVFVSSTGWILPTSLQATEHVPLSAPDFSTDGPLDIVGLRTRAAAAVLSNTTVLENLRARFGLVVEYLATQLPAAPTQTLPLQAALVEQTTTDAMLLSSSTAASVAGVAETPVIQAPPGRAALTSLPLSNAALPKRLRKFRSDASLSGAAAAASVGDARTADSGDTAAAASLSDSRVDVALRSPSAGDSPAALALTLEALLCLPLRLRPTPVDALLQSGSVAAAAANTATVGSARGDAAVLALKQGAVADMPASVASKSSDAPSAGSGSSEMLISNDLDSGPALASQREQGVFFDRDAGAAVNPKRSAESSVFRPAATAEAGSPSPRLGGAEMLALLDNTIANFRKTAAVERAHRSYTASATGGGPAALAGGALSSSRREPEVLRLVLEPLRGDDDASQVLRISADPGTLFLLEAAHERATSRAERHLASE